MICEHDDTRMVKRRTSNGVWQVVRQCQDCGRAASGPMRHAVVIETGGTVEDLPEFDAGLHEKGREFETTQWRQQAEAKRLEWESKRGEQREEWRAWYTSYLASPEWQERRQAVPKREHHLRQGCRQERATEVHHLTYEHVGEELLFELVAVCRSCHEKAHQCQSRKN